MSRYISVQSIKFIIEFTCSWYTDSSAPLLRLIAEADCPCHGIRIGLYVGQGQASPRIDALIQGLRLTALRFASLCPACHCSVPKESFKPANLISDPSLERPLCTHLLMGLNLGVFGQICDGFVSSMDEIKSIQT